jgi:putative NADPH-quinone reductase
MGKKIIAIVGSYRKGGIVDSAIDAILRTAAEKGAEVEKIYLTDQHIEFCTNCRTCTQAQGAQRGTCIQKDDMDALLAKIEKADALVLGSPTNFFNVTAVTRRFIERLVCYAFWPWGQKGPAMRSREKRKKAVLVTSSAMPAPLARFFAGSLRILKIAAETLGAKPIGTLSVGMAALTETQELSPAIVEKARKLGHRLGSDS